MTLNLVILSISCEHHAQLENKAEFIYNIAGEYIKHQSSKTIFISKQQSPIFSSPNPHLFSSFLCFSEISK